MITIVCGLAGKHRIRMLCLQNEHTGNAWRLRWGQFVDFARRGPDADKADAFIWTSETYSL